MCSTTLQVQTSSHLVAQKGWRTDPPSPESMRAAPVRHWESVNVSVNFRRQRNTDYVRNQSGTMLRERVTLLRVSVTRIGHLGSQVPSGRGFAVVRVGALMGWDGCEVRLCDPCARVSRVCPGYPRCLFTERLPVVFEAVSSRSRWRLVRVLPALWLSRARPSLKATWTQHVGGFAPHV